MDQELLNDYLERPVVVWFAPHMVNGPDSEYESGRLHKTGSDGLVLEMTDGTHLYIPHNAIRTVEIKPKPSFWQRLTGVS